MNDQEAQERREFFRVQTFARVGLRVLRPHEVEEARARLKIRHVPAVSSRSAEELRLPSEVKPVVELLERIALTLDRMDRKLDALIQAGQASGDQAAPQALEIVLSGSGFSGPFKINARPGTVVEVQIDLWEAGVPAIPAIARLQKVHRVEGVGEIIAFSFEEILAEDRERIIQFALRSQSEEMRKKRMGEPE